MFYQTIVYCRAPDIRVRPFYIRRSRFVAADRISEPTLPESFCPEEIARRKAGSIGIRRVATVRYIVFSTFVTF